MAEWDSSTSKKQTFKTMPNTNGYTQKESNRNKLLPNTSASQILIDATPVRPDAMTDTDGLLALISILSFPFYDHSLFCDLIIRRGRIRIDISCKSL